MLEKRKYLGMSVTDQNYIHIYVFPSPVQNTNVKGHKPKFYWTS